MQFTLSYNLLQPFLKRTKNHFFQNPIRDIIEKIILQIAFILRFIFELKLETIEYFRQTPV